VKCSAGTDLELGGVGTDHKLDRYYITMPESPPTPHPLHFPTNVTNENAKLLMLTFQLFIVYNAESRMSSASNLYPLTNIRAT
jgi:hypothetical protein